MAAIKQACPLLAAADPKVAASWYRDQLGFRVVREAGDYSIVQRDGVELHFWRCAERHIAENTSAYLRVDDVDGLHAEFAGVRQGGRVSLVADREWGMREFYVWDPDGNLLRIGRPTELDGRVAADKCDLEQPSLLDRIEALQPDDLRRSVAQAAVVIREGRL